MPTALRSKSRVREFLLVSILLAEVAVTAAHGAAECIGDCDGDGGVSIEELVSGIDITLGNLPPSACAAFACGSVAASISCAVRAVRNALDGCQAPTSTPTPTPLPAGGIRYRLRRDSSLTTFYGNGVSLLEPLSGEFVAVPVAPSGEGVLLRFAVESLDFRSQSAVISGSGQLESTDAAEDAVTMTLALRLNDQQVEVAGMAPPSALSDYPPTLRYISLCGGTGGPTACESVDGTDGLRYRLILSAQPEATQTPVPSFTPTPTHPIRYRLLEGSTIVGGVPTPGAPPPVARPLSGTFSVVDQLWPRPQGPPPNTLFAYALTDIDLHADPDLSIAAGPAMTFLDCGAIVANGCLSALTFIYPPEVYVTATIAIDGDDSFAGFGSGGAEGNTRPPVFTGLEICVVQRGRPCDLAGIRGGSAAGYVLTVSATPEDGPVD
jgi:hypothetical protein